MRRLKLKGQREELFWATRTKLLLRSKDRGNQTRLERILPMLGRWVSIQMLKAPLRARSL